MQQFWDLAHAKLLVEEARSNLRWPLICQLAKGIFVLLYQRLQAMFAHLGGRFVGPVLFFHYIQVHAFVSLLLQSLVIALAELWLHVGVGSCFDHMEEDHDLGF